MNTTSSTAESEANRVRAAEHKRIHALVSGDIATAKRLIADDFQLIAPIGMAFSKEQYLGAIEAGVVRYLHWEAVSDIVVRMYGDAAFIRYQAQIEVIVQGQTHPLARYWFTDGYEKRDGNWQIVWSQGTAIP